MPWVSADSCNAYSDLLRWNPAIPFPSRDSMIQDYNIFEGLIAHSEGGLGVDGASGIRGDIMEEQAKGNV